MPLEGDPSSNEQPSGLLSLPFELREAILIEYLRSVRMTVSVSAGRKFKSLFSLTEYDADYSGTRSSILRTCRQLRNEVAELVSKQLPLEVRGPSLANIGSNIPKEISAKLEHVYIVIPEDLRTMDRDTPTSVARNKENAIALKKFPNLRKITLRGQDVELLLPEMHKAYSGLDAKGTSEMRQEWMESDMVTQYLVATNSFLFPRKFGVEIVVRVMRMAEGETRGGSLAGKPLMILKTLGTHDIEQWPTTTIEITDDAVAYAKQFRWTFDQMLADSWTIWK